MTEADWRIPYLEILHFLCAKELGAVLIIPRIWDAIFPRMTRGIGVSRLTNLHTSLLSIQISASLNPRLEIRGKDTRAVKPLSGTLCGFTAWRDLRPRSWADHRQEQKTWLVVKQGALRLLGAICVSSSVNVRCVVRNGGGSLLHSTLNWREVLAP